MAAGTKRVYAWFRIEGRCTVEVDAKTPEDLEKKARIGFEESDFGDIEVIDGEVVHYETEEGRYLGPEEMKAKWDSIPWHEEKEEKNESNV